MSLKKKLLKKSRLYVIVDKRLIQGASLPGIVKLLRNSPADIIQLRDKQAGKGEVLKEALLLRKLFSNCGKLFIINDYPQIAKIVDADGVHLGQGDLAIKSARRLLGRDKIIGASCHTLKQARKAQKEGADYIGMGPLFPTKTKRINRSLLKPELIRAAAEKTKLPVFAIGGINTGNLGRLLSAGIKRIAVASAILCSGNIISSLKKFDRLMN